MSMRKSNVIKRMSSYFIASSVYNPHLSKAAIVDAGWPGQPPLFPAQVACKQTNPWRKKQNHIYVCDMCMNCVCQKNPSFQPAAVSMCFHNVHPCGPSELKFLHAISYSPSQGSSTCLASHVSSLAFAPAPERANQNSGPEAKSRPLSVRKELQKLFRTIHTKDRKAWYHLRMLDEILSVLFRTEVQIAG